VTFSERERHGYDRRRRPETVPRSGIAICAHKIQTPVPTTMAPAAAATYNSAGSEGPLNLAAGSALPKISGSADVDG